MEVDALAAAQAHPRVIAVCYCLGFVVHLVNEILCCDLSSLRPVALYLSLNSRDDLPPSRLPVAIHRRLDLALVAALTV